MQQEEPFSRARCRPSERVGAGSGCVCARARAHVHAHPHLHTRFPQPCSAPKPSELSPVCTAVPTPVPRLRGSSAPPRRTATATHASGEGSRRHSRLAGVGNDADFVFPVRNPNGKSLPAFPCLRRPRSCWRRAAGCALAAVPCASLCPGAPLSVPTQFRVLCCGLVLPPPAARGREKAATPPSSAGCRHRWSAPGVILLETIVPRAVPRLGRARWCSSRRQAGSGALCRQRWSAPRNAGSQFVLTGGCGPGGIKIDYGPRTNAALMQ